MSTHHEDEGIGGGDQGHQLSVGVLVVQHLQLLLPLLGCRLPSHCIVPHLQTTIPTTAFSVMLERHMTQNHSWSYSKTWDGTQPAVVLHTFPQLAVRAVTSIYIDLHAAGVNAIRWETLGLSDRDSLCKLSLGVTDWTQVSGVCNVEVCRV